MRITKLAPTEVPDGSPVPLTPIMAELNSTFIPFYL